MTYFQIIFVILMGLGIQSSAWAESYQQPNTTNQNQISSPKLSPNGKYIAMLRPVKNKISLVVQKADGTEKPNIFPPVEPFKFKWFEWANNKRLLISFEFTDKARAHRTRLLSVNKEMTDLVPLVEASKKKIPKGVQSGALWEHVRVPFQDRVLDFLPHDPDHILLQIKVSKTLGEGDKIWKHTTVGAEIRKVNVTTGDYEITTIAKQGITQWTIDQKGETRFGHGIRGKRYMKSAWVLKYRDVDQTEYKNIEKKNFYKNGYRPKAFLKNPNHVVMAKYKDGALGSKPDPDPIKDLIIYDMTADKISRHLIPDAGATQINIIQHPITKFTIGFRYLNNGTKAEYFDNEYQERISMINEALPETYNEIISVTHNNKMFIIKAVNEGKSESFFIFDENTMALHPFT